MKKQIYSQLSSEERDKIAILRAKGFSISAIARNIGRNKSTISRELKRNGTNKRCLYWPHKAEQRAKERKKQAGQRPRLKNRLIKKAVIEQIRLGWSPEIIAGRLRRLYPGLKISHEAIYQFIYAKEGREMNLKQCLPRAHRIRQRRGFSRKHNKSHIPWRVDIDQRPGHIELRHEIGHWEVDTIASRRPRLAALAVVLERTSRAIHLRKIMRKTSLRFSNAVIDCLKDYPSYMRRTITYDNGPENVQHQRTNRKLGTQSYFCRPYHSWEKGSVEQVIGLIRFYIPKKTDITKVSDKELNRIENLLNNRPRKCLDFYTPSEVFNAKVALPC
jgi:IS30 family transposase